MAAVLQSPQSLISSSNDRDKEGRQEEELSLIAFLLTLLRKSLVACRFGRDEDSNCSMEIGWPTNVRHISHVTFDRFHGFLGLPVEFEPEVPRRAPSASVTVFGVSTESMQCSFDSRGNSVPTILLLMQRRLYELGGLQAEGIFRINAENGQEELVRDQLNHGIVLDGIDVHCLAGLIKAWFRELPTGVLDSLNPEQVMQCQTEEECAQLVKLLPPTQAALLDWAVNLMADVVLEEHNNKMNARNVAMVFAPNMTQMDDPLTALMYAVQVMNFLKMLILRALKERQEPILEASPVSFGSPDENEHYSPKNNAEAYTEETDLAQQHTFVLEEPHVLEEEEEDISAQTSQDDYKFPVIAPKAVQESTRRKKVGPNAKKGIRRANGKHVRCLNPVEKSRGISIMNRINSKPERAEAWR